MLTLWAALEEALTTLGWRGEGVRPFRRECLPVTEDGVPTVCFVLLRPRTDAIPTRDLGADRGVEAEGRFGVFFASGMREGPDLEGDCDLDLLPA